MSEAKVRVRVAHNAMHLPVVALRGLVVFPNNVVHFEVGRQKSIAAIEAAMHANSNIFLIAQKDMETEEPTAQDLYAYGVISEIKQVLRVSEDLVKVLVEVGDEKELKEYEADTLQFKRRRGKKGGQELSKEEQKELEKLEEIEEKEEAEERAEKRAEQRPERQDRREQRADSENRGDNRRRDGRRDDNRRNNNRGENQNRNDNRGENRNNENRGDNRRDNNRDTRRDNNRGDRRRENRPQNRPEQVRENSDAQGAEQSGSQGQAPRDNSFRRRPRHGGRRDGNNGNNGNGRKPENTNEG